MSNIYERPAPDVMSEPKTAEEWGRLAVSLPGWRWMPGMYAVASVGSTRVSSSIPCWWLRTHDAGPDPDDPATAGCLLAMIGADDRPVSATRMTPLCVTVWRHGLGTHTAHTLGRACIAAAAALGRWPGGVKLARLCKELDYIRRMKMGYNTTVLILNDALSRIKSDPEEFVKSLCRMAGSGKATGDSPIDFHLGSQSGVIQTHHADNTAIILVGGNSATVLGARYGWKHNEPEFQIECLKWVLRDLGHEVRKMPTLRLERELRRAEKDLERENSRLFVVSSKSRCSWDAYRAQETRVRNLKRRVDYLSRLLGGEE